MDVETFRKVFTDFTIAYIYDDWAVSYQEGNDFQVQDGKLAFNFEMPQLSEAFLEFYIYPPRMFPPTCMESNPVILFELYHSDGTRKDWKEVEVKDGYINLRVLDLNPGKYVAKCKVYWT
jgi:hypothetical protein